MKSSRLALVIFIVVWLIIKIVFLRLGDVETGIYVGVFNNILAMIVLPFLAIKEKYSSPRADAGFLSDVKTALQPSVMFAVIISIGIFIYFSYIDPEYTANRYKDAIELLETQVGDETSFQSLQKENPALSNMSREEYMESQKSNIETIFSVKLYAGGALIALVLAAILYGIAVTLLYRKFLLKKRGQ